MDVLKTLAELGGYWKYNGGRHVAATDDGKVSDTFLDTGLLTRRPDDLRSAVDELLRLFGSVVNPKWLHWSTTNDPGMFVRQFLDRGDADDKLYICGRNPAGITLAYEAARQLNATAIFTEPVYEVAESGAEMLTGTAYLGSSSPEQATVEGRYEVRKTGQRLKRFQIPAGSTVLFVEDEITTGKSTREMLNAVAPLTELPSCPFNVVPYILCLVNKSGSSKLERRTVSDVGECIAMSVEEFQIISLANVQARTWDTVMDAERELRSYPEEQLGLEALRPKDNWDKLKWN